jgi:uncharacterized membrane protein YdjX (TVP38/TMEM64 family)
MKFKSNIVHAFLSLGILTAFIVAVNNLDLAHRFDLEGLIGYVSRKGKFGEITFLLIFGLKPLAMILPSNVFAIAAGTLFGPLKGFFLNMIGFFLSATVGFFLSRMLGTGVINKLTKGKLLKFDKGIEKNGFKIMALLRFPPIFPYDIVSMTAGVTKIKYSKFILGSVIGIIPENICYSLMGKSIEEGSSLKLVIPFISMVLILIITMYLFKKMKDAVPLEEE